MKIYKIIILILFLSIASGGFFYNLGVRNTEKQFAIGNLLLLAPVIKTHNGKNPNEADRHIYNMALVCVRNLEKLDWNSSELNLNDDIDKLIFDSYVLIENFTREHKPAH